jgi:branched-subunit amino acid transport protein
VEGAPVSWWTVLGLAAGAYGFKALGLFAFDARPPSPKVLEALRLLPPALLGALIVVQTVVVDEALVVDARLAGVAAGGYAAWSSWSPPPSPQGCGPRREAQTSR